MTEEITLDMLLRHDSGRCGRRHFRRTHPPTSAERTPAPSTARVPSSARALTGSLLALARYYDPVTDFVSPQLMGAPGQSHPQCPPAGCQTQTEWSKVLPQQHPPGNN